jgi:hypothetical protein
MRSNRGARRSSAVKRSSSVEPLGLPVRGASIAFWMSTFQSKTFAFVSAT